MKRFLVLAILPIMAILTGCDPIPGSIMQAIYLGDHETPNACFITNEGGDFVDVDRLTVGTWVAIEVLDHGSTDMLIVQPESCDTTFYFSLGEVIGFPDTHNWVDARIVAEEDSDDENVRVFQLGEIRPSFERR